MEVFFYAIDMIGEHGDVFEMKLNLYTMDISFSIITSIYALLNRYINFYDFYKCASCDTMT